MAISWLMTVHAFLVIDLHGLLIKQKGQCFIIFGSDRRDAWLHMVSYALIQIFIHSQQYTMINVDVKDNETYM